MLNCTEELRDIHRLWQKEIKPKGNEYKGDVLVRRLFPAKEFSILMYVLLVQAPLESVVLLKQRRIT